MPPKRLRADEDAHTASSSSPSSSPPTPPQLPLQPPSKRQRTTTDRNPTTCDDTPPDLLSPLSDELLIRILSYLSLPHLLAIAPVSRRFHHLSEDSQLWKALYYARFVLPRAMRIPGFRRDGLGRKLEAPKMRDHRLHYNGRRFLWADGRMGGLVRDSDEKFPSDRRGLPILQPHFGDDDREGSSTNNRRHERVNWKRQFKIRHNWARGKCAVEELKLDPDPNQVPSEDDDDDDACAANDEREKSKMLVKAVDGLAVTADGTCGLRAWDLKTREVMAQARLQEDDGQNKGEETPPPPSCLAIDDRHADKGTLEIAVGFTDGSFGVWRLAIQDKTLCRLYRHEPSSNGELMGMAYSHPYLLTATGSVLISLYTFDVPEVIDGPPTGQPQDNRTDKIEKAEPRSTQEQEKGQEPGNSHALPAPYLVTSLKSHSSEPPLALSIRKMASTTIASIAYTFYTRQGWSIGIQDLHIAPHENPKCCPNITTRLAYTPPFYTDRPVFPSPQSRRHRRPQNQDSSSSQSWPTTSSSSLPPPQQNDDTLPTNSYRGPTTLCYTHPYLLATLPDNTLILHLCTSTSTSLSISPGIRLWGHTSGISDAEITARGKAVSVSSRGGEMRVWELEGRPSGVRSRSVEIRPGIGGGPRAREGATNSDGKEGRERATGDHWEERRNWVGFDDEMVIVLKEAKGGRESLLVYDFT